MEFNGLVEFDEFRLDLRSQVLMRVGEPVRLPPKCVLMLGILVRAYPDVVSRDELRAALWPDVAVDESNLTQSAYLLRKNLGNTPEGRPYVETLPKRGYRFTGHVVAPGAAEAFAPPTQPAEQPARGRIRLAAGLAVFLSAAILVWRFVSVGSPRAHRYHPEAVALYEQGRVIWKQRRVEITEAETCFRRAIRIDPEFDLAWVGLADVLAVRAQPATEAQDIVNAVLQRNPGLAEAHASAGFLAMLHRWDWRDARRHLDRSVELNPRYTWARQWRALYFSLQGQPDYAVRDLTAALAVEPASVNLLTAMCSTLYFAGKPHAAEDQCQTALEIDPHFVSAGNWLVRIYSHTNNPDAALKHFSVFGASDFFVSAYRAGGLAGLWRARLGQIEKKDHPYFAAEAYAFLGDRESALEYLERARESHDFFTIYAGGEPAFTFVRNDPRFRRICLLLGVPASG